MRHGEPGEFGEAFGVDFIDEVALHVFDHLLQIAEVGALLLGRFDRGHET